MKRVIFFIVFIVISYSINSQTNLLYGLWRDNTTQNFVSVDKNTGEKTVINSIPGNPVIISGSSTFFADSGQYIFLGNEGNPSSNRIYTIDIKDGSVRSKPIISASTGEYKFDPVTNKLYGLWYDNGTQNFVSVDKNTGDKTVINSIPGNPGILNGSSTFFADSGQYIFIGNEGNPSSNRIYTIDIKDGSVKSKPINSESAGEYEFDPLTNKLYGLWQDNGIQNFISVNKNTGEKTVINSIPGNPAIINGSSIFYADSGQYIFVGTECIPPCNRIYTIDIKDGSLKSNPLNPENTGEYEIASLKRVISNTNEPFKDEDIVVFPNPSKGILTFKNLNEIKYVELYDMNGCFLKQFRKSGIDNVLTCDLSSIPNGIYVCKLIKKNGQSITRKVTVNN